MKIIVLDANAYWTESLFRECGSFADILLLKPRDFRAHHLINHKWRSDVKSVFIGEHVWEQRLSMPPGWMVEIWSLISKRLKTVIKQFVKDEYFIFVFTYPQYRTLITEIKPTLSIYYNLDDYRDNWPRYSDKVYQWEEEAVAMSDITLCIADYRARKLRNNHPQKTDNIYHLPLGTTPAFIADDSEKKPAKLPKVLEHMERPVAGYIGALNWRFDYQFLAEVATGLPDVNFVLGGKIPGKKDGDGDWQKGLLTVQNLKNVHFIGWVEHDQIGNYLKSFDVLFMCYSECNFNQNACPAKLWDYMGAGRPIFANKNNPETLLWNEVIYIAETPSIFATKLKNIYLTDKFENQKKQIEIAENHTWNKLAQELKSIINDYL